MRKAERTYTTPDLALFINSMLNWTLFGFAFGAGKGLISVGGILGILEQGICGCISATHTHRVLEEALKVLEEVLQPLASARGTGRGTTGALAASTASQTMG